MSTSPIIGPNWLAMIEAGQAFGAEIFETAGTRKYCQLFNPLASGVDVWVREFSANSANANMFMFPTAIGITVLAAFGFDYYWNLRPDLNGSNPPAAESRVDNGAFGAVGARGTPVLPTGADLFAVITGGGGIYHVAPRQGEWIAVLKPGWGIGWTPAAGVALTDILWAEV